jgi:flagellar motor switch protein FliG
MKAKVRRLAVGFWSGVCLFLPMQIWAQEEVLEALDGNTPRNNAAENAAKSLPDAAGNSVPNAANNVVPNVSSNGAWNGASRSNAAPALNASENKISSLVSGQSAPAPSAPASFAPSSTSAPSEGRNSPGIAGISDPEMERHNEVISSKINQRLFGDLQRYCLDYCNVLSMDVTSQETFETGNSDLGFEGTTPQSGGRTFATNGARVEVMVDTRFGSGNIDRLQKIFQKILERYPIPTQIQWSLVTFPDSATNAKSEAQVRGDFSQVVRGQLERVVAEFCPRDCKIHSLDLAIARAGVDEIQNGNAFRYLFSRDGRGALYVRGVSAVVSLNSLMDAERKDRIRALMNETLEPFGSVNLQTKEIPFPRSAEEVQKDLDMERGDPWGLKKLSEALKVFREFANTKEIVRERETQSSTNSSSSINSELSRSEREKNSQISSERNSEKESESAIEKARETQNKEMNSQLASTTESGKSFWTQEMVLIAGGILLALVIAGALGLRYVVTGKRMQQVINEGIVGMGQAPASVVYGMATGGDAGVGQVSSFGVAPVSSAALNSGQGLSEEVRRHVALQSLRDELVQIFVTQPKVARDVFGRMIREDGIENTSRYVVIFGEMMIFELLGDADLKKEIDTLAEYIHVNAPVVKPEEQVELLRALRLKMTAGKMRLMTSRTLDMFDFLKSKSPRQIFDLIGDEAPRSQAIVLTQLSTEKRRAVFELYEGQAKVDLLRELSNNSVVQREYLHNVAEALKRKAQTKPSFEGENVQGIDVLLDLLERAELQDQRDLMADLDKNSLEIARTLRTRLVTIETLPYLRDGLLLEVFLSMEAHTMATFLAGTRDHIRNLILSKAPADVAENWVENLEQIRSIDTETMRLAEMQVISKVRSFANQGLLSVLDINLALYPKGDLQLDDANGTNSATAKRVFKISNPLVA